MNTIIENLNTVITTKSQIQSIIKENGIDPGEVFSDYPQYLRQVISDGGSDKVSYSYLEEKLSYYPTYSYVDENYVSYSYLGDLEDITYYILGSGDPYSPENVYATKFELGSYVKTTDLQSMSYVSITDLSSMGYVTSNDLPVIDENIIPKKNNTYTLGNAKHIYSASYTKSTYFTNNSKIVGSDSAINFYTGGLSRITINNNILRPDRSGVDLGSSSNQFINTYTSKIWFNSGNAIYNDNAYQIVLKLNNSDKYVFRTEYIRPISNNGATLGTLNFKFNATYTSNIYTDTAYLQDTSYSSNIIPNETNTYTLGDEDHLYSATYSTRLKVGNNSQIYNDGGGITFSVNSNAGIRMGSSNFYPKNNKGMNLGQSSNKWSSTYTSNLYTDTAYISSATYLPVNTYWYDGNSYHWVGDLFN